ncbi:F0F1 ATP synthase subunit epsilon (plasmid) [Paroceanicella profunda]|uniref:ATP synthase epsilon chain n=1 Tax=Paroceanicella profunda TaxID=2579971 RepID=A0A5B8FJ95_9RHOB|nr:F0F1 ATP synthase subunit epsilon [Paroceanicella profunda]QDL93988.1 F0F1 ATP synthase subunit epsilon [Paroceanicella profunda]
MSAVLRLTLSTPSAVLVDRADVVSLRAEDRSGGFGILPRHADFLTVLPASLLRWRCADGAEWFCALGSGVLRVSGGGRAVSVACRQATLAETLAGLGPQIAALRAAEREATSAARVEQIRMEARAVRQLQRLLRPGPAEPGFSAHGETPR